MPIEAVRVSVGNLNLSERGDNRSRESRQRLEDVRARIFPIRIPTDEEVRNMASPPLAPHPLFRRV